jgi:hypothetical protein
MCEVQRDKNKRRNWIETHACAVSAMRCFASVSKSRRESLVYTVPFNYDGNMEWNVTRVPLTADQLRGTSIRPWAR